INCGQQVYYWRKEPLEIDLVLDGSWGKFAVEIKSGEWSLPDLRGLSEFCTIYPKFQPLLVCDEKQIDRGRNTTIPVMSWKKWLLTNNQAGLAKVLSART
ncbi:MAG: ATP-binding protein, partial [Chitinivibrionales bacterium]|nr:ATP-binding protein [Chitinivibrionales bacterium]